MYVCSLAASYYTIILVGTILAATPPAKTCAQATHYETIELSLVAQQATVATNIRQLCTSTTSTNTNTSIPQTQH